jgi:ribose 5-phosphate isomerase A
MSDEAKRLAALAALGELPEEGIIGLGTGSTAKFFVEAVAELVRGGRRLVGVCTSTATRALAAERGIPLLDDAGPWKIEVTVDGADEVADNLDVSKGAGGALTREKIVAFASRRLVVICDATKRVRRIGEARPLSLEILTFGHRSTIDHLARFGRPVLRAKDGAPVMTDGGNLLVDLAIEPASDPGALDRSLRSIPGVVETGLFVGLADLVLVAGASGTERLTRQAGGAGSGRTIS